MVKASASNRAKPAITQKMERGSMAVSVVERKRAAKPVTPATVNPAAKGLPVAILAPTGKDSYMAEKVLEQAGLQPRVCADMAAVCDLIGKEEICVLLMAEEALAPQARD